VAQPALSRAVRALEREVGVRVFERRGRGVKLTSEGREVVSIARRVLSEVDRLSSLAQRAMALHVCAVPGQAREVGSPAVARFVTGHQGRAVLDVVDTADEVVEQVRDGRAALRIIDLPGPRDLHCVSLGWQEIVLVHPGDWSMADPFDARKLSDVPLLSFGTDSWRHAALEENMRIYGVDPNIAAQASERELLVGLVQDGAGAWFSYGRQAQAAVDGGAGLVHLDPPLVREVGIISLAEPDGVAATFIDIARTETEATLLPPGDELLARASWIKGTEVMATAPPATSAHPLPPPA
jgi:DNA-binding transcriptional LysR family regulator